MYETRGSYGAGNQPGAAPTSGPTSSQQQQQEDWMIQAEFSIERVSNLERFVVRNWTADTEDLADHDGEHSSFPSFQEQAEALGAESAPLYCLQIRHAYFFRRPYWNADFTMVPNDPRIDFRRPWYFQQSAQGRITNVFYLADELPNVVDLKKGICGAFHASLGATVTSQIHFGPHVYGVRDEALMAHVHELTSDRDHEGLHQSRYSLAPASKEQLASGISIHTVYKQKFLVESADAHVHRKFLHIVVRPRYRSS